MNCESVQDRLGEYLDDALADETRRALEQHLDGCRGCRARYADLAGLAEMISAGRSVAAPPLLWTAIEHRLDTEQAASLPGTMPAAPARSFLARAGRPLAAAAAILLIVGAGWLFVSAGGDTAAVAARIDFTPLLDRLDQGLGAGIDALKAKYHGAPTTVSAAAKRIRLRLDPDAELPDGMTRQSMNFIYFGPDPSLAIHFAGPASELLVMQCPPKMQKQYGARDCLPCSVGAYAGHEVRLGKWRLTHFEQPDCCICIVTTLEHEPLEVALDRLGVNAAPALPRLPRP